MASGPHAAERRLQISLAALTSLGTLLLGMGERNVLLPVLAVIIAVSSVYLTDYKGWLQLNTLVANVAGLIAGAVTVRDWNSYAAEGHLVSLANLLIYLQFVLLYRKKNLRNYWLLLLLSLLQVAVAAALNMSVSFGALLPVYMFVGLITMALFVIHREQVEHAGQSAAASTAILPDSAAGPSRRWPLAGQRAAFQSLEAGDASRSGLGSSFFWQITWLAATTFLFAIVWFFGLPRAAKKGPWQPAGVVPYTSVGFAESVTLGQLGDVYENPEEVMQVSFREFEDPSQEYRIGGNSALFRGSVLYLYESRRWAPLPNVGDPVTFPITPVEDLPKDQQLVREHVMLRGRSDGVVFTVSPAFALENTRLRFSPGGEQLWRSGGRDKKFTYDLVTTAFRDHLPQMSTPAEGRPDHAALAMPETRRGIDPLGGLRLAAAQIAGQAATTEREHVARAVEAYLRDSHQFQYSLNPVRRTPGLDPVEDFVTEHRSGHCEYFASALALMLRSLGIPARLAIGFKGGEWNSAGHYYQIRELHAHAWVEAYVGPEALPTSLANNAQAKKNGAWLTLDPTPSRSVEDEYDSVFGIGAVKRMLDLTQLVWTNYVLGMDSQRQQETIYIPLVEQLENALRGLAGQEGRQRLRDWLARHVAPRLGLSQGLFSWQGLLTSMIGLLLLIGTGRLIKMVASYFGRWRSRRPAARGRSARRVEFYEQFEALLARYGMPRTPNQTPREFALATGGYLAESPLSQQAGPLPRRIADAFYRARFGRQKLDNQELQSVEKALSDLAAALAARHERARAAANGHVK
jgi:protein-glutamine gamma-glutamyltransferase